MTIVKLSKNKYELASHKGKNLGTYTTKNGAMKREKQVEFFKHLKSGRITKRKAGLSFAPLARAFSSASAALSKSRLNRIPATLNKVQAKLSNPSVIQNNKVVGTPVVNSKNQLQTPVAVKTTNPWFSQTISTPPAAAIKQAQIEVPIKKFFDANRAAVPIAPINSDLYQRTYGINGTNFEKKYRAAPPTPSLIARMSKKIRAVKPAPEVKQRGYVQNYDTEKRPDIPATYNAKYTDDVTRPRAPSPVQQRITPSQGKYNERFTASKLPLALPPLSEQQIKEPSRIAQAKKAELLARQQARAKEVQDFNDSFQVRKQLLANQHALALLKK